MATLSPIITGTPGEPPSYNVGMAETFSWIPIENDANRPLFARAGYITNLSDLSISLSASDINIGAVEIADGTNHSVRATIVSLGGSQGTALKVLTQDLESSVDDVTIGDKAGNFAAVNKSLSALRIFEVAPVTAVSILNTVPISGSVSITNPTTAVSISNIVAVSGSVTVLNPVTQLSATILNPSFTVLNPISSVSLTNPTTAVNVLNTVAVSGSLTVLNPVTAVSITNQLTGITVTNLISSVTLTNPVTSLNVANTVAVSGSLTVVNPVSSFSLTNQLTSITITNPTTAVSVLNTVAVSGSVTVLNPVSSVSLTNQLTGITILNPVTAVSLINQLSSFSVTNPTTAVNINNTVAISGSVTVLNSVSSVSLVNQISSVSITNTVAVSGGITVLNPVSSVSLTNQLTSVTILNPVTAVSLLNQLSSFSITNPTTAVYILNTAAISGSVTILNPVSSVTITNPTTAVYISNTAAISGSITVLNPITAVSITNPTTAVNVSNTVGVSGSITVTNPTTGVQVLNPVALKDLNNNNVTVTPATSSLNVNVTNPIVATVDSSVGFPISFAPSANFDAFGRLRTSSPLTLFDSSHRYRDNNLWSTLSTNGGSVFFNQNQGLIDMTVSSLSGSTVIRETTKVFSYQPGKAILVMNTFVMAPSAQNLRQRVGYFGQDNGIYVQLDGGTISFVERSLVNGSPSTETIVPLSSWNGDKLDGTGPSNITLDITKAQIFWMDIEWLGVGTVRCGFVINGQFIVCHSFHHANLISSTYITTASLPLRYEITNKGATDGSRTLKQVCSTVISEGGYELRGLQQAIGIPITAPRTFAATDTYYPIASIRLKTSPDRMDAIVILTALSILGSGNGINYNWQVRASGVTTGGAWNSAGIDSAVEYNITGTSYTGGRILASGFLNASNQASPNLDILKEALFKFQLERNNLTKTPFEITLVAATDTVNGSGMFASVDWEEVSR